MFAFVERRSNELSGPISAASSLLFVPKESCYRSGRH